MKRSGMFFALLRGNNQRFWSQLDVDEETPLFLAVKKVAFRVHPKK